jgi:hypothetical protein
MTAVSGLHAATSNAAGVLAGRIRSTASALSDAAAQYALADDRSVEDIAATMDISMR